MDTQTTLYLKQAIQGLLYTSESDAPFEVIQWPGDGNPINSHKLLELECYQSGTPVETIELEDFFKDLITDKSWYGPKEKEMAQKYRNLENTLKKNLKDIQVFKVGEVQVDVYIVGTAEDGSWDGVRTAAVET